MAADPESKARRNVQTPTTRNMGSPRHQAWRPNPNSTGSAMGAEREVQPGKVDRVLDRDRYRLDRSSCVMASLGGLILLSLLGLGGCAGAAPTPQPTDYPLHESWLQLDIHWRLAPEAGTTRAAGLVVRRIDMIR